MVNWWKRARNRPAASFLIRLTRRYFLHDVGRQAAALAYYLLFTLFPFMIFVSSLLGVLSLDISGITSFLRPLLPEGVTELVEMYLQHVSGMPSAALMWFALVFSVWFPMRAVSCLMRSVRRAYHLPKPKRPARYGAKILLYTLMLLLTIAVALILMTVGQRALRLIGGMLRVELSGGLIAGWSILRFGILAILIFAAVGLLYAMAQDQRRPGHHIVPGALVAMVFWVAISAGYSFYVEYISDYSVVYGALGAVVVLLIWLYLTAVVLIMGAEVNDLLLEESGGKPLFR